MSERILIVYDVSGWAFHRWAEGIQKYSSDKYEVHIADQKEFSTISKNRGQLRSFSGVLNMSWTEAGFPYGVNKYSTVLAHHGCMFDQGSDWLDWNRLAATNIRNKRQAENKLPRFDSIICTNHELFQFAKRRVTDCVELSVGVDDQLFSPKERQKTKKIVAGWCGQSPEGTRTTKGFHEILEPLMEKTKEKIDWRVMRQTHTSADKLNAKRMVDWYRSLDVFVMTSISEGVPNPIFEAAACGVPVIGTDVGDIRSLIKKDEGWIVPSFNDQKTSEKTISDIKFLMSHIISFEELEKRGKVARRRVESDLSWKCQADKWCQAIAK